MRHYPRRFGVGVPVVFALAIGAGVLLAERNLSLALAALLLIQTVGLLGLYIPALRERLRVEAEAREAERDLPEGKPEGEGGGEREASGADAEAGDQAGHDLRDQAGHDLRDEASRMR